MLIYSNISQNANRIINKLLSEQRCPGARNSRWGMLLHVNEAGIYVGQNKIGVLAHVYHVWHIDCWVLHTKWYPSVRIDEENPSYTWIWEQVKWRSMSKQNKRCTSMSCWHYNACMIICLKGMAFDGNCTQSGTHTWGSTKKIQVIHDLERRLYGGQGQNKIGGAHLPHVGIAMHAW